jgi:hypothetical protein
MSAILDERTWTLPAFDKKLANYRGEVVDVDLGVNMRGATIACVVDILGSRIADDLRQRAIRVVCERHIAPFQEKMRNPESPLCGWANVDHNWNAVCHSAVALSALALVPDRVLRGAILEAVERGVAKYRAGFPRDGYCGEGMVYWNYGFGHYVVLAAVASKMTGGLVDLLQYDVIGQVATFPDRLELRPGMYPAFADSPMNPQPHQWLLELCRSRIGGTAPSTSASTALEASMLLYEVLALSFTESTPVERENNAALPAMDDPLRGWFPESGVLIARPEVVNDRSMAAVFCGGDNSANHNHNDVGQVLVSMGERMILVDPGGERYTAATFSAKRYESEMLNSLGHSVPRIGGMLQRAGPDVKARVIDSAFSDKEDRVTLDISSAYEVPGLLAMKRTFTFQRGTNPNVTIRDVFELNEAKTFEAGLITYENVVREGDAAVRVGDGSAALRVQFDAGDQPIDITLVPVKATRAVPPTRIAYTLKNAQVSGTVTCRIEPASNE